MTGETAARFEEICQMGIDQEFIDACMYIIEEHPSINKVNDEDDITR